MNDNNSPEQGPNLESQQSEWTFTQTAQYLQQKGAELSAGLLTKYNGKFVPGVTLQIPEDLVELNEGHGDREIRVYIGSEEDQAKPDNYTKRGLPTVSFKIRNNKLSAATLNGHNLSEYISPDPSNPIPNGSINIENLHHLLEPKQAKN